MMAPRKRKRQKKWIGWLLFLILLVIAGVVCYLVWDAYFKKEEPRSEMPQDDEVVVVDDETEPEPEVETVVQKEEVVQYDGDDPNESGELTGVITYVGVTGDTLAIRVNIDQYLSGGGCRLSLARGEEELWSEEAEIVSAVATSTCEGFNVPVVNLGSGNLAIKIFLNAGGKTGVISGGVNL